jgi:hypothetical protein
LSTPIVKAWSRIIAGSPVYALDQEAGTDGWLDQALVQVIPFQSGRWTILIEDGYTVFRIYPYLSENAKPRAYQGMVLKVNGRLSKEELVAAIRERNSAVHIDEYELFGEGPSVQRYSRPAGISAVSARSDTVESRAGGFRQASENRTRSGRRQDMVLAAFLLMGFLGIMAGTVALSRSLRELRFGTNRLRILAVFAAGVLMAILSIWVVYPWGASSEIIGFPFPTTVHVKDGEFSQNFMGPFCQWWVDFLRPLATPMSMGNAVFWFLFPNLAFRAIRRVLPQR